MYKPKSLNHENSIEDIKQNHWTVKIGHPDRINIGHNCMYHSVPMNQFLIIENIQIALKISPKSLDHQKLVTVTRLL